MSMKLLRPDAAEGFDDPIAKKSLSRYFAVVRNEKPAKFKVARKIAATFSVDDSFEVLWKEHGN